MSFLEVDGPNVIRHFFDGEKLPLPWEDFQSIRESDVFILTVMRASHATIEGLGWVMLATATEEPPAQELQAA